MNDIFSDLLDVCVVIYLDDILIYSNNMSEHHWHVKEVLKHLYKAGLYAKAEKCKFYSELVEYLGYILSSSGLTMSNDKVKIIQDWLEPKKVKNIQSFLGFANFYCQFIFNYLDIVILLTCLTQKDIPWKFNSSCCDAFNFLKKAFTFTSILTYWILDAQLIVETDALDYALTVILFIVNEENRVYPVAFHSHTFTMVELNYDMHDKELLAIFEAFKIWRHYLEGLVYPIDIVTDHKNLEYFSTTKVLTGGKHSGPSTFLSSTLSSGSVLAILAQNRTLSLDSRISILKGGILATPQSTLTTSSPSLLKNNLRSLYKLLSSFSLFFAQL